MLGLWDPIPGLGIAVWLIVVITIWEAIWKFIAMWKAAKKGSVPWFIVLGIVNTVGILPILYIYVFSKMGRKGQRKR